MTNGYERALELGSTIGYVASAFKAVDTMTEAEARDKQAAPHLA